MAVGFGVRYTIAQNFIAVLPRTNAFIPQKLSFPVCSEGVFFVVLLLTENHQDYTRYCVRNHLVLHQVLT